MMRRFFHQYLPHIVFLFLLLVNAALYFIMYHFHTFFPFGLSAQDYQKSYHFFPDERFRYQTFSFLNAIAPFDAQWYLRIAAQGYPRHPLHIMFSSGTYAFFPLYPMCIWLINLIVRSVTTAGLISSNSMFVVNFWSLYYVLSRLLSRNIALKTSVLLFLFPLSIFFRSYFPENLYLFLLIWFGYFFVKKNYLVTALFLSLLSITKGNGFLLYLLFAYPLVKGIHNHTLSIKKALLYAILSLLPLAGWIMYCFFNTGNPLFFFSVRIYWTPNIPLVLFFLNLLLMKNVIVATIFKHFTYLGFLQIDTAVVFIIAWLLSRARKVLSHEFWWISFLLWLGPLVMTTIVSFTRYQIVSFPLFVYLATVTDKKLFVLLCVLFTIGLFFSSLFFVNWYWLG